MYQKLIIYRLKYKVCAVDFFANYLPESQNLSAFELLTILSFFFSNKKNFFLIFRYSGKLQKIKTFSGRIEITYEYILNIDLLESCLIFMIQMNLFFNTIKRKHFSKRLL